MPIMCEPAGCRLAPLEEYSCSVETETLSGQETKHCGDTGRQGMEEQALPGKSTWEDRLEWEVLVHGAYSLESFCIFTRD